MPVWAPQELGNALVVAGVAGLALALAVWLLRDVFARTYPKSNTTFAGAQARVTRDAAPSYVTRQVHLLRNLGIAALIAGISLRLLSALT